jgi:N-methylhydantoinase A
VSDVRIGIDIGGTFTDIVALRRDGSLHTKKVSSTVDDYSRAIVTGLGEILRASGFSVAEVAEIRHGTTVASNAILERKGARTGLIATAGFRDILEIRTLRMPRLYDMTWQKPPVLVPRYLRVTVDERLDAAGRVQRPLAPEDAARAVRRLLDERVEAIAVCLLHAYANPVHEQLLKDVIQRLAPDLPCAISSEVLPEIREYERTSTTVIDAYVQPVVRRYLRSLQHHLEAAGARSPLLLMQSNGGLMTARSAAEAPVHIVESGPAAGVVGAQALAAAAGLPRIITLDMGGTTAKAALVEDGEVTRAAEYQVGGGIMTGSRLLTGAGYTLKVPAIDLAEVGAGGGSIIRVDAGGALRVGPESAGAMPGPACYDQGGEEPTVTDANVVLGYLTPEQLVGGEVPLNPARARAALAARVAGPLGLELEHAAFGAHLVAASNMIRAIRAVSSERGRDARGFTLVAFGGNGPLFAAGMAAALGIGSVLVPPVPGVFSSFGLLCARLEHHYARSLRTLLRAAELRALNEAFDDLERQARSQLAAEGVPGSAIAIQRRAAMHYHGQIYELTVAVPDGPIAPAGLPALEEAFGREHERTYGHRAGADEPVELVSVQLIASAADAEPARLPDANRLLGQEAAAAPSGARAAYFGPERGWLDTPVLHRGALGAAQTGPCIIEEYDATCLVPPGARAVLDRFGNIIIDL